MLSLVLRAAVRNLGVPAATTTTEVSFMPLCGCWTTTGQSVWLLHAICPPFQGHCVDAGFWQYTDSSNSCHISVSLQGPRQRPPLPSEKILGPRKKWTSEKTPATQIDVVASDDETAGGGEASRSSPSEDSAKTPPRKRLKPAVTQSVEVALSAQFPGWTCVDDKGTGDCGFRAVARALAVSQKKDLAEDKLISEASKLRTMAVGHLLKHKDKFEDFWAPDPSASAVHRDGAPEPTCFEDYVMLASRRNFWIDGLLFHALSARLGRIFIIFVWSPEDNAWKRHTLAPTFVNHIAKGSKDQTPLCLILSSEHFRSLVPKTGDTVIPEEWLRETDRVSRSVLRGAGKGSSLSAASSAGLSLPSRTPDSKRSCPFPVPQGPTLNRAACSSDSGLSLPCSSARVSSLPAAAGLPPRSHPKRTASRSAGHTAVATEMHGSCHSASSTIAGFHSDGPELLAESVSVDDPVDAAWEKPVFRKGRPPTKVKTRLNGKQGDPRKGPKFEKNMPWQWKCPISTCGLLLKGTYSGVAQARYFHVRRAHAELPPERFHQEDPIDPIETSPLLPASQRDWSCPLCDHGLPAVASQVRKRAIRAHCSKFHPKETLKSLSRLVLKGQPNSGVSSFQSKRRHEERQALFPSHKVVKVTPVEKRASKFRGNLFYCAKCFSRLRGSTSHKAETTCEDRQREMQVNGFVLSRKRAWWMSWLANEPLTAQSFLDNSGLTKEHMASSLKLDSQSWSAKNWHTKRAAAGFQGVGRRAVQTKKKPSRKSSSAMKSNKGQPKVMKSQTVTSRHGGFRGKRVGEASNPGPLSICSLNCQGENGARSVLTDHPPIDIWFLQETWFSGDKARAFRRSAYAHGYVAYTQDGPSEARGENTGSGGVAVLVRRGLPQRSASQFYSRESQGIFVWVQGIFVGSIYAPPYEASPQAACAGFMEAMISANVKDTNHWLVGGDFNEVPTDSAFAELIETLGGKLSLLGRPTRFQGRREVDFFGSNCSHLVGEVVSPDLVFSDHRILSTTLDISVSRSWRGVLPRGTRFARPAGVSPDAWREKLRLAWDATKLQLNIADSLYSPESSAQDKWDSFQEALRHCFLLAHGMNVERPGKARFKGAVVSVRTETMPSHGMFTPMKERKVRHQLARWYELSRLRGKYYTDEINVAQQHELRQLCWKLTSSWDIPSRQVISANVARFESSLRQQEKDAKQANLASWRFRMASSSSHVSKWLSSKEWSMCSSVIRPDGSFTDTWHASTKAIHEYWTEFWRDLRANIPPFEQRAETLLTHMAPPAEPVAIHFPTGEQLLARAQDSSGSAGPDGWTAEEIRFLPLDVFDIASDLFRSFASLGQVPGQFQQSRMCCIPKPNKITQHAVKVADARPITVMSVWWRLWSSTLCRSDSLRSWLQSILSSHVGGVSREDIYENLIEVFDAFHKDGFVLTLDYTKAFDCLDSALSCRLLLAHGWPRDLVNLLQAVWQNQSRFVQYDHHTHERPLDASGVQPQGDPWGPLMMSLWVQAGVHFVLNHPDVSPQNVALKTYLDDRTCTAASALNLQSIYNVWVSWSTAVGLREASDKTKVSAVRLPRMREALRVFGNERVSSAVRVLGAVSVSVRRKYHPDENLRFQKAKRCARLLGYCGLPLKTHLNYLRQFSLSKVNYGWVARGPTWTSCKSLWSCFWSSARKVRYSSPWLRALFLGGNLHLDVTWVTRLLSAILRFRLTKRCGPLWSHAVGTPAHALRSWMSAKGFAEVAGRPWVWHHSVAQVTVDVSVQPSVHTLASLSGVAAHNCRAGWRAWIASQWSLSKRHEVAALPALTPVVFRSLKIEDTRSWILSSAEAAAVGLGATFSPATWSRVRDATHSPLCPWGCHMEGFWEHVAWSCSCRPRHAPSKPACAFLARFGWRCASPKSQVDQVRRWLIECQKAIWGLKESRA